MYRRSQYACDITVIVEVHVCVHSHWTGTVVHDRHSDKQTNVQQTMWITPACPITCGGHCAWWKYILWAVRKHGSVCKTQLLSLQQTQSPYSPNTNKMFFLFLIPLLLCVGGGSERGGGRGLCGNNLSLFVFAYVQVWSLQSQHRVSQH